MAELARGRIDDRPWGLTFGALGLRGLTGQLTVVSDGKRYCVAFAQGAVVGATSPVATDAAIRVALTGNLVSTSQVSDIARQLAAVPDRDEIEVIASLARLPADKVQRLRRRVVAQRAARTFAVEQGDFIIEDRTSLPVVPGNELDIRSVVYLGAKTNLSEQRLVAEIAQLGAWFKLKPEAVADLAQYGFTETERPVLERLQRGKNLAELVGDPDLDARTTRTVIYALVACSACEAEPLERSTEPPRPRTMTNQSTELKRDRPPTTPAFDGPTLQTPRTITEPSGARPLPSPVPRSSPTRAPSSPTRAPSSPTRSPSSPTQAPSAPPALVATPRSRGSTQAIQDTVKLIAEMVPLLDSGVDHFKLLGLPFDAPADAARTSYFNLARKLHPDRLSSLGLADTNRHAQRLFAQINTAFAVLTDPVRREEYLALQRRGGEAAVREEDTKAEELAMRVLRAEEAFKAGEMALKRDHVAQALASFTEACELQPQEPEYQALLAWAKFAAATDKQAVAGATRTAMQKAAEKATKSPAARFYLGRMERMLGREKEALAHFHEVLQIKPNHAEAAAEVRLLEQRLKGRK